MKPGVAQEEEEEEEEGVRQNDNSDTDHGQKKRGYSDCCYRAASFAWFRWWYSANARGGVASFVLV